MYTFLFLNAYMVACKSNLENVPYAVLLGNRILCKPEYEKKFKEIFWKVDYVGSKETCEYIFKRTGFYEHKLAYIQEVEVREAARKAEETEKPKSLFQK